MTRPKNKSKEKRLTDAELELMNILWRIEAGTVHDVMQGLPSTRKLAYTSVSTIFRILEKKGIVASRKEGRGHVYFPNVSKENFEALTLKHVVKNVFDNTPSLLVRRLIEDETLSNEELSSLKALLNERLGE